MNTNASYFIYKKSVVKQLEFGNDNKKSDRYFFRATASFGCFVLELLQILVKSATKRFTQLVCPLKRCRVFGVVMTSPCLLAGVSSPGGSTVTQSHDVSVEEGGAVDITCCWTLESDRFRVYWQKNQTVIKGEIIYLKNHSHGSLLNETTGCSVLTFTNVTPEDSGRYICKVIEEIPSLSTAEGDGTVITVRTRDNTAEGMVTPPQWHYHIVWM